MVPFIKLNLKRASMREHIIVRTHASDDSVNGGQPDGQGIDMMVTKIKYNKC
jgi:hypothetical protein